MKYVMVICLMILSGCEYKLSFTQEELRQQLRGACYQGVAFSSSEAFSFLNDEVNNSLKDCESKYKQ